MFVELRMVFPLEFELLLAFELFELLLWWSRSVSSSEHSLPLDSIWKCDLRRRALLVLWGIINGDELRRWAAGAAVVFGERESMLLE